MYDLLSTLPMAMNEPNQTSLNVVEDENGVYVKGLSCLLAPTEEEALKNNVPILYLKCIKFQVLFFSSLYYYCM